VRSHKLSLIGVIIFGGLLIALGLVLLGVILKSKVIDTEYKYYSWGREEVQTGIAWYMWLTPLVAGTVVTTIAGVRYSFHFREVCSGVVTGYYHSTMPNSYTTEFYVTLYGYTRAGELRHYDQPVDEETWRDTYVGQELHFE
jgi:hypothetical protein